jgi:hypothetical protein
VADAISAVGGAAKFISRRQRPGRHDRRLQPRRRRSRSS